jgi:hypothetical protein
MPDPPAHPFGQLTTGELDAYKRVLLDELEKPCPPEVVEWINARLDEVRDEQQSRASIAQASKAEYRDPMEHYSA